METLCALPMRPTWRRLHLDRIMRRSASTNTSHKPTVKSNASRLTYRHKSPAHSNTSPSIEHQIKHARVHLPKPERATSALSPLQAFRSFCRHPQYRWHRRIILILPALVLGFLHRPYDIVSVSGPSMSPFLNVNSTDDLPTRDSVLIHRWASSSKDSKARKEAGTVKRFTPEFERGQIVVFPTPHQPDKWAVKRVVAIAGDIVQPLPGYTGGSDPIVVPWNHIWVEGDVGSRSESMDSNWYGPISQELVLGEVKAVLSSWWKWHWLDWREHAWPARQKGRVEENAVQEAAVDPDAVEYNSGWRNGSIALILERMRRQPDQALQVFVNDPAMRQEARRLYNNALYVVDVATSLHEKKLAKEVLEEMEDLYGREALVFGIRTKKPVRDRGELPSVLASKPGDDVKDQDASDAEKWLKKQGWELARNTDGSVRTQTPTAR